MTESRYQQGPTAFVSKNTEKWNSTIWQEPLSFFLVFAEYEISALQGKNKIFIKQILECVVSPRTN